MTTPSIKFPSPSKAKKPARNVQVHAYFGAGNQISYTLPAKPFADGGKALRDEIRRRNANVSKAEVIFPGDETPEVLTFKTRAAKKEAK